MKRHVVIMAAGNISGVSISGINSGQKQQRRLASQR